MVTLVHVLRLFEKIRATFVHVFGRKSELLFCRYDALHKTWNVSFVFGFEKASSDLETGFLVRVVSCCTPSKNVF